MSDLGIHRPAVGFLVLASCVALNACEPSSIFDVERFGEIRFSVDLAGVPAEDSDGFRIRWQHREYEEISREESFFIINPPEDYDHGLLQQVPVGEVRVTLTQFPPNCTAEDRETTVTVEENEASSLTFTVACD